VFTGSLFAATIYILPHSARDRSASKKPQEKPAAHRIGPAFFMVWITLDPAAFDLPRVLSLPMS
jgi:hypothetical protein